MRTFLLLFFIGSAISLMAQPANDDCGDAEVVFGAQLACGGAATVVGTTVDATADNATGLSCIDPTDLGVWYTFTAEGPDIMISELSGAVGLEVAIIETNDPCGGGTEIACGSVGSGDVLTLDNQLTTGTAYALFVAFDAGGTGNFELCIENWAEWTNTEPCAAEPLVGGTVTRTTYGTDYGIIGLCGSNYANIQVFSYTVPAGIYKVQLALSSPDITAPSAYLALVESNAGCTGFDGTPENEFCDQDISGSGLTTDDICVSPGDVLELLVGTPLDVNGEFTLTVTDVAPDACSQNEVCDVAESVNLSSNCETVTLEGCNTNACPEDFLLGTCDFSTGPGVWYQFTADGNARTLDLLLDNTSQPNMQLGIFEACPITTGTVGLCEQSNAGVTEILQYPLTPGTTYYILVSDQDPVGGTYNLSLTIFPNLDQDDPCGNFIPFGVTDSDNNCTTPEGPAFGSVLRSCPSEYEEATAWYEVVVPPGTPNIMINVTPSGPNPIGNSVVQIGRRLPNGPCSQVSFEPLLEVCDFSQPAELEDFCFDFTDSVIYYVMVGTETDQTGSYTIDVSTTPTECPQRDSCTLADVTNIARPQTPPDGVQPTEVCLTGCTPYTCPEGLIVGACDYSELNTIWFKVETDNQAVIMNLDFEFSPDEDYQIAMFSGDCDNLVQIPLDPADICFQTSMDVIIPSVSVDPNTSYYIMVAVADGQGGDVDLCVTTEQPQNECVNDQSIEVIARENPLPLTDPYCPGELITFRYEVDWRVDPQDMGNDCQWLQGLIPIFGNGWDQANFDPTTANLGNPWDWYGEAETEYDTDNFRIATYTEDGILKLSHVTALPANYDASASLVTGTPMPAGWFAVTQGGQGGGCNWPTNDPDEAYGLPAQCNSISSVTLTFSIRVKEDCMSGDNLDISMFTFSDGAIGCWNIDLCGRDLPVTLEGSVDCAMVNVRDSTYEICSGDMTNIVLDAGLPNAEITYTVISTSNVSGAADGTGNMINQTLTNDEECNTQEVEYLVLALPPGGSRCGPDSAIITVIVYDEIQVNPLMDNEFCPEDQVVVDLAPLICGGTESYTTISWTDDRGNSGMGTNISRQYDPGLVTISVSIEDDFGCTGTGEVQVMIRENMDVEIIGPDAICAVDLPATLVARHTFDPSSGLDFTFEWTLPGVGTVSNDSIQQAFTAGNYMVTVSDDFGCEVSADWDLQVNPDPVYTAVVDPSTEICPGGDPVLINLLAVPTVIVSWEVPDGFTPPPPNTRSIQTDVPGTYTFTLTDPIGCTSTDSVVISILPRVLANADTVFECNDGTGQLTWDLTSYESIVLNGSNASDVAWFVDSALTQPIDPANAFVAGDTVVYVVALSNDNMECDSEPVPFYLQFLETFIAMDASQERCLEPGGFGSFDLEALVPDISGGNGTVEFYAEQTLNTQITGDLTDFESPDTILYAIIVDGDGCVSNVVQVVLTTDVSLMAMNASLSSCLELDGTATFNLRDAEDDVTGGANLTVLWYSDQNFTPIMNPDAYNAVPGTVFAEVSDGTCASNLAEVTLTATTTGPAGTGTLNTCDEGGQGTYDLIANGDPIVLDGNTGTVFWFEDAAASTPVGTPSSYTTANTAVYAIFEDEDGCISDIMEIMLELGAIVAIVPDDLEACGTGTAVFDLTVRDAQVTDGQAGRDAVWYSDPGATMQITNPENYESASGVVYVVAVQGPCMSDPVPLNLNVTVDLPADPGALDGCIQASGEATFNLNDANSQITSNSNFIVRYYLDTTDVTDSIQGVSSYQSGDATIFAIVFDGDCRSFAVPVELSTSIQVFGTEDQVFTECLEGGGQSTFDLDSYADQVAGGNNRTVAWFEDPAATIAATPSNAYVSGPTTLYVVITDEDGCISDPMEVNLDVDVVIDAAPANIVTCDIGGGVGMFDLTDYDDEVTGGLMSQTVTWYTDTTAAPIANPMNFSGGDGDVVFAIVSDGICVSYAAPYILSLDNDLEANPATIQACDDGGTGIFNLEGAIPTIIGTNPYMVEFYEDIALVNQITGDLTMYTSAPGVIYAITLDGPCQSQPVEVTLTLIPEIIATAASDEACDDGTGSAVFNLTTLEGVIDNGQGFNVLWYTDQAATNAISDPTVHTSDGTSVWAVLTNGSCASDPVEILLTITTITADNAMALACDGGGGEGLFNLVNIEGNINADISLTVTWFTDPLGTQVINDPANYSSAAGTVYASVSDGTCTSPIIEVELELTESLPINEILIENCDDGDGAVIFDLSSFETEINVGGSGDVIWYTDAEGTQVITDEMTFESGSVTVFAQVVDEPCRSVIQPIELRVNPLPLANAGQDQQLDCATTSLTLNAQNDGGDLTILWTTDDGNILTPEDQASIDVDEPGTYRVEITNNTTGCVNTDEVVISASDDLPTADAGPDLELTCGELTQSIGTANTSTGDNIAISWTRNGEDIGSSNPILSISDTGVYVLTVINTENNCSSDDEVVVTSSVEVLSDPGLNITTPNCNGDNTGCVALDSIVGGVAPYSLSVDGTNFSIDEICNLGVGNYDLTIRDANGCEVVTPFEIGQPEELMVQIVGEQVIDFGTSSELTAIHTPANVIIDDYVWSADSLRLTLTDLPDEVLVQGFDQFDVAVQITDENGCIASDVITILVRKNFTVYIPNAFSPGRLDDVNDFFYVYGSEEIVTNVDLLQIYDRWGEKVYERTDVPINADREHGWNGTFQGDAMLPGAYVYVVQVTFIDGSTEEFTGTLNLID